MTVHVMRLGKPLCAFSDIPAKHWPKGHTFVGHMADEKIVTCETCKQRHWREREENARAAH